VSYSSKGRKVRRRRKNVNVRNLSLLIGSAVVVILLFILLVSGFVRVISKGIGALTKEKDEPSAPTSSVSSEPVSSEPEPEPALTFSNVQLTQVDEGQGELILVDAEHGYQSEIEDLQIFWGNKNSSYGISVAEIYAKPEVVSAMNEMMADFASESGITSTLLNGSTSAYRNYSDQQTLYQKNSGSDTTVAQPGYSEHHTGYAVDLSYNSSTGYTYLDGSGSYAWIDENCYQYGFVVRYPDGKSAITGMDYEPWHLRYVGKVHAEAMTKGGYCLEEYIDMLKLHDYESPYEFVSESGASYQIYYVASGGDTTELPAPNGKAYTVSGTNEGGFIVTVAMSSSSTAASTESSAPANDSSAESAESSDAVASSASN
jgi:D-alanyl-D-alanine carboxypeptidase